MERKVRTVRKRRVLLAAVVLSSLLSVAVVPALAVANEAPPVGVQGPPATTEIVVGSQHLGTISKYLFGANLLWADDAEGAFNPATGSFDPAFVSMLKRLDISILRYPGGTTSDSFHWMRAIGPDKERKANEPYGMQAASLSKSCCVLDGPTPSTVGPDEFGRLLDQTGAAGTVTVNFATGSAQEAADFVAYMTAPPSKRPSSNPADASYWAELRARNGHRAPYNVPYWEVGNEQYFPGQYGWRSGEYVSMGPHSVPCPPGKTATCLYAFGGTTQFSYEAVGTYADERPSASYSTGAPGQDFYVYFPPIAPGSTTVFVEGRQWSRVADLGTAGPKARVYKLDPATGEIIFGDGHHGAIPPKGDRVTVSYDSGPHGGFVEFYKAMKAMNPHILVCESEGANLAFLALMGKRSPYDCAVLHQYARPVDVEAPLRQYEEALMEYPVKEGQALGQLQSALHKYSGKDLPVLLTEYGQLVAPVPAADPQFNLSLDEGLLIGAQLAEWIAHGIPVAEKYLVDSAPFTTAGPGSRSGERIDTAVSVNKLGPDALREVDRSFVRTGLSVNSAIIAHQGGDFVVEPSGQVLGLMSRLGGSELVPVAVSGAPALGPGEPALWLAAGVSRTGHLYIAAVNADPGSSVRAQILLQGWRHARWLTDYTLDGASPTSLNTTSDPDAVATSWFTRQVGAGNFDYTFPAHSLSLLQLSVSPQPYHVTSASEGHRSSGSAPRVRWAGH